MKIIARLALQPSSMAGYAIAINQAMEIHEGLHSWTATIPLLFAGLAIIISEGRR